MNKRAVLGLLVVGLLFVFAASAFGQVGYKPVPQKGKKKDYRGFYTQEREICGPTVTTPELHEATCSTGCECIADGKWCFKPSDLVDTTPNQLWAFSGPAYVKCVTNNDGSCQWNALGKADRFSVSLNNPTEIKAKALTSSRSIGIALCAPARFYPPSRPPK